ncbi:hypothetical protein N9R79_08090 [Vibrio sp.]|nr:hypothetical protein [Vibrio sp.]
MFRSHYKSKHKNLLAIPALAGLIVLCSSNVQSSETEKSVQVDVSSEMLATGDMDIEDDVLLGAEVKAFFWQSSRHHPYSALGYKTDLDDEGVAVEHYYVDLGAQYDVTSVWGKGLFIEYSIGLAEVTEDYSIQLIDRNTTHSYSESVYKASFGAGINWNQSWSSKLYINQFDDTTNLGLSVGYAF